MPCFIGCFIFLRCSEIAITSNFDPKLHPTISDLSILDSETITYFIKQSKTDQERKGHYILIFNLPSPINLIRLSFLKSNSGTINLNPHWTLSLSTTLTIPLHVFGSKKHLKHIFAQSGLPAENFSSHSFRIGAATTAAKLNPVVYSIN